MTLFARKTGLFLPLYTAPPKAALIFYWPRGISDRGSVARYHTCCRPAPIWHLPSAATAWSPAASRLLQHWARRHLPYYLPLLSVLL